MDQIQDRRKNGVGKQKISHNYNQLAEKYNISLHVAISCVIQLIDFN